MSLSISKHVYAKLSASDAIKSLVGDRIHAITTLSETQFPFIIYQRTSLTPSTTKDRYSVDDAVTVEVVAVDDNYLRSVELAEAIRSALDKSRGDYGTFRVTESNLTASDEVFAEDAFVQRLSFSFTTD